MTDFETHPVGTAAKLAALQYDTPEAINITDKAARELLEVEKLKAINSELLEVVKELLAPFEGKMQSDDAYKKAKEAIEKAEGKA